MNVCIFNNSASIYSVARRLTFPDTSWALPRGSSFECSEISYQAVTTAMTRLAQKVKILGTEELLTQKAYFDCNPPGKSHWY